MIFPNRLIFLYRFGTVHLCPVFWQVPTTGTDSRVSFWFSKTLSLLETYGPHARVELWSTSLLTLLLTVEPMTMSMVNPAVNNSPALILIKLSIMLIHMNTLRRTTQPSRRVYDDVCSYDVLPCGVLYDKYTISHSCSTLGWRQVSTCLVKRNEHHEREYSQVVPHVFWKAFCREFIFLSLIAAPHSQSVRDIDEEWRKK